MGAPVNLTYARNWGCSTEHRSPKALLRELPGPNHSHTNESKYEVPGDNEIDFVKNRVAARAFRDKVPQRRYHLGKTQFGVGGRRLQEHEEEE